MRPKEKAKELMIKFRRLGLLTGSKFAKWDEAKKCAIILCEEIIKNNKNIIVVEYNADLICSTQYWKKVIEEIKKL